MNRIQIRFQRSICLLLCLLMLFSLCPISAGAENAPPEVVRVGWYEDSYNITGAHGERSGYGYEYQQAVSAYTGWTYEYVQAGWSDLLEMMKDGEIDLMSGVSYTEERAQDMLFSDAPMGEEKYYLYANLTDAGISASDLKTLNGKRVGLLEGSIQATQFYQWEEEHGLQMQDVYVTSFEDAKKKVAMREIDCLVSTETPQWVENGMSAIATTGGSGIYFVINKKRPDLKEKLDNAMRKMEYDKPFYSDELYRRYLSSVSVPTLSSEEQTWLEEHGAIRIGWLNNDSGFSNLDLRSGQFTGVITDYITFASDCLGNQALEFDLVGFDTLEDQLQALKNGEIDMIFHASENPYVAEQNGFALSNTVLAVNMAAVTPQSYFNENEANRVAIVRDNLLLIWYVSYNYPQWIIVECDSDADVEDAIQDGRADCLLAESGLLTTYIRNNKFHTVFLTHPGNTAFAVQQGNSTLLSILNKTLKTIPSSMMTGALAMYDTASKKVSAVDFIKDNLLAVSAVITATFLLVLLLILSFLRTSRRAEATAKQSAAESLELNQKLQESQRELRAALQRAESANAAKTTFLNNVSHDIRTPMNAIIGLTTLMENDLEHPDKLREYLGKLKASSQHLLNLISEILDMNKIESGKVTLNNAPFTIAEQLSQVDNVIRSQAKANRQEFSIRTHNIQHEHLIGDATRLQQILLNILSNAVKYTGSGGHISFDVEEIPRSGHYARYKFTITDDGIGMSEEFQKHIYEAFTRAENSVTNKVQGTGLGMAITKSIVDMMGGSISLTSQLGKGSSFEVLLEFKIDPDEKASHLPGCSSSGSQGGEPLLKGMRFLCAEDNEINSEILQALLESRGASCTICHNGEEIVEKFRTVKPGEYAAILMDVQMPKMNGYEATRAIRSGENPLGKTIPIIAMTANAFAEDVQKSYEAGMDSHLSKPVDIQLLEQTLRHFRSSPNQ